MTVRKIEPSDIIATAEYAKLRPIAAARSPK